MANNKVILTAGEAIKKEGLVAESQTILGGTFVANGVGGYSANAGTLANEIAIADYSSLTGMDPDASAYVAGDQFPILYPCAGSEVNVVANAGTFIKGQNVIISSGKASPLNRVAGGVSIGKVVEDIVIPGTGGKVKVEIFGAPITVAAVTLDITSFVELDDVDGGDTTTPTYTDATAVIAALPTSVVANVEGGGTVNVPASTWVNTDTYDKTTAASYTFTATLGAIPAGYTNSGSLTVTVEVVVS